VGILAEVMGRKSFFGKIIRNGDLGERGIKSGQKGGGGGFGYS
jgi:hypothetical protein